MYSNCYIRVIVTGKHKVSSLYLCVCVFSCAPAGFVLSPAPQTHQALMTDQQLVKKHQYTGAPARAVKISGPFSHAKINYRNWLGDLHSPLLQWYTSVLLTGPRLWLFVRREPKFVFSNRHRAAQTSFPLWFEPHCYKIRSRGVWPTCNLTQTRQRFHDNG